MIIVWQGIFMYVCVAELIWGELNLTFFLVFQRVGI